MLISAGVHNFRIQVILSDRLLHITDSHLLAEIHLDHGSSGEVNSIIEATYAQRHQTDYDHSAADAVEDFPFFDEMEFLPNQFLRSAVRPASEERILREFAVRQCADKYLRDDYGGEDTDDNTDHQGNGKSLHCCGAQFVQNDCGDKRGDLRVQNGDKRMFEALVNGHPYRPAQSDFLFDSGENNYIGIHCHTDIQDDTGDTRKRQNSSHRRHDPQYENNI